MGVREARVAKGRPMDLIEMFEDALRFEVELPEREDGVVYIGRASLASGPESTHVEGPFKCADIRIEKTLETINGRLYWSVRVYDVNRPDVQDTIATEESFAGFIFGADLQMGEHADA